MNAFKTFLLLTFLAVAATTTATATDWPLHFDAILNDRYVLVVLHEGGRAQVGRRGRLLTLDGQARFQPVVTLSPAGTSRR